MNTWGLRDFERSDLELFPRFPILKVTCFPISTEVRSFPTLYCFSKYFKIQEQVKEFLKGTPPV